MHRVRMLIALDLGCSVKILLIKSQQHCHRHCGEKFHAGNISDRCVDVSVCVCVREVVWLAYVSLWRLVMSRLYHASCPSSAVIHNGWPISTYRWRHTSTQDWRLLLHTTCFETFTGIELFPTQVLGFILCHCIQETLANQHLMMCCGTSILKT